MAPSLPVGGSAFDITWSAGVIPSGLTEFGATLQYTDMGQHYAGSSKTDRSKTSELQRVMTGFSVRRHIGNGWSVHGLVPVGTLRVKPEGGRSEHVSGFGDTELSLSYNFTTLWHHSRRAPRVVATAWTGLPTAKTSVAGDPESGVPPNIVSLGFGSFAAGGRVDVAQPITQSIAALATGGVRQPLSPNNDGLRLGRVIDYGLGVSVAPAKWLSVFAMASGRRVQSVRSIGEGKVINSGGDFLSAQAGVTALRSKHYAVSLSGRVPFYFDVNGEQLVESFGVAGSVVFYFEEEEKQVHEHKSESTHGGHAHGEESDDHGHEHGHGEATQDHHGHEHAADPQSSHQHGDIEDLTTGGASFVLADALVADKITVIDFWADWCEPCGDITTELARVAGEHHEVAVRKVEVPDFDAPVAVEHLADVGALPVVWIFPPGSQPIKLNATNAEQVIKTIELLL